MDEYACHGFSTSADHIKRIKIIIKVFSCQTTSEFRLQNGLIPKSWDKISGTVLHCSQQFHKNKIWWLFYHQYKTINLSIDAFDANIVFQMNFELVKDTSFYTDVRFEGISQYLVRTEYRHFPIYMFKYKSYHYPHHAMSGTPRGCYRLTVQIDGLHYQGYQSNIPASHIHTFPHTAEYVPYFTKGLYQGGCSWVHTWLTLSLPGH
jgi:hypothetical protein